MAQDSKEGKPDGGNILRLLPTKKRDKGDDPIAGAETRIADEFVDIFCNELVYVAEWGRWMLYVGTHWIDDSKKNRARHMVREICERTAEEMKCKALASAKTIASVEAIAKVDLNIAESADRWDRNKYALNTPAGTVNLKSGKVMPHDPGDFITKITAVAPGGDCPTWLAFLDRVTNGDPDMASYLQRIAGYALTGDTKEHVFFFFYGPGGNGKSTFLETLSDVMGDYAEVAPIDTFTATRHERHPTDLAGLRGSRLVTVTETEQGRNWAESKIKQITGGDKVKARFMRQDFFWYTPEFKLVIAGNHMPGICSVDEAMRRRIHLVPFSVTIPPEERDHDLKEKLRAEWGGILKWAIDGALEWQRGGLAPPHTVRHATKEYLSSQDTLSQWLESCTIRNRDGHAPVGALYESWKRWAEKTGEHPGTMKSFSEKMKHRGFEKMKKDNRRGYLGLELVPTAEP